MEVDDELLALQAIYDENELSVEENEGQMRIIIPLLPNTAMETEKVYVKATIVICIPKDYPSVVCQVLIQNTRGLDDQTIFELKDSLEKKAQSLIGQPMIFDLIETTKEILTENNSPKGNCPICLDPFENFKFHKTNCFHFFHVPCLKQSCDSFVLSKKMKEQIPFSKKDSEESSMICPVCRSQLSEEDIHVLGTNEAQIILDSLPIPDFQIPSEIRQFQLTMDKLWVEQHQKGGIINPEENLKRFVVDGSTFISVPDSNKPQQEQEQEKEEDSINRQIPEEINQKSEEKLNHNSNSKSNSDTTSKGKDNSKPQSKNVGSKFNQNQTQNQNIPPKPIQKQNRNQYSKQPRSQTRDRTRESKENVQKDV